MAYSDTYSDTYDSDSTTSVEEFQERRGIEWGTNTLQLYGLEPGATYKFSVAAFDIGGRSAGFSTIERALAEDNVPPSKPAPPTTISEDYAIGVAHDFQKASGGVLEADTHHLDIHFGTTTGYTPDSSTKVGELAVLPTATVVRGSFYVPEAAVRFVRVIAVDSSGNESTPSDETFGSSNVLPDPFDGDVTISGTLDVFSEARLADGTEAAPGLAWSNDPNTGFRRPAADTIAISLGGQDHIWIDEKRLDLDIGGLNVMTVPVKNSTGDVSNPKAGDFYYNSVDDLLRFYDGSAWTTITRT